MSYVLFRLLVLLSVHPTPDALPERRVTPKGSSAPLALLAAGAPWSCYRPVHTLASL